MPGGFVPLRGSARSLDCVVDSLRESTYSARDDSFLVAARGAVALGMTLFGGIRFANRPSLLGRTGARDCPHVCYGGSPAAVASAVNVANYVPLGVRLPWFFAWS